MDFNTHQLVTLQDRFASLSARRRETGDEKEKPNPDMVGMSDNLCHGILYLIVSTRYYWQNLLVLTFSCYLRNKRYLFLNSARKTLVEPRSAMKCWYGSDFYAELKYDIFIYMRTALRSTVDIKEASKRATIYIEGHWPYTYLAICS